MQNLAAAGALARALTLARRALETLAAVVILAALGGLFVYAMLTPDPICIGCPGHE